MVAPLRTLSSRILLGFAAIIATFGVTTVLIVRYMDDVGVEIAIIRTGYLRLALTTKDLERKQDDLRSYLTDELVGEATPRRVELRLRALRSARLRLLNEAREALTQVSTVPERHQRRLERASDDLQRLADSVAALDENYGRLLAAPPIDSAAGKPDQPVERGRAEALTALATLRTEERALSTRASNLAEFQKSAVTSTAKNLEYNEERLRLYTIVLGIIAIMVGLLVTVWVTLTLRPLRRLREGAQRIGAGDPDARIEERGPAEVADLAREFNAMARAVDERQRELVRSERLAAIGKMAAMVTHEVRNPLSSIALNTELLGDELSELPSSSEAKALCAAITREVDRLTGLTEDYLSFARLPKPTMALSNLNELVRDTTLFLREELASHHVTLEVTLEPALPRVQFDPGQLRQCVINLLRNSVEAMTGRPDSKIWLSTTVHDDNVELAIRDNGPGIPADALAQLFEPFFTTKLHGTGLGLAVSQQILRDHGGVLDADGSPGNGATFWIRLPLPNRDEVALERSKVASIDGDERI